MHTDALAPSTRHALSAKSCGSCERIQERNHITREIRWSKNRPLRTKGVVRFPLAGLQSVTLVLLSRKLASGLIQYPYLLSYLFEQNEANPNFSLRGEEKKAKMNRLLLQFWKSCFCEASIRVSCLIVRTSKSPFSRILIPNKLTQFLPTPPLNPTPPPLVWKASLSRLIPLVLPALSHSSSAPSNIIYDWLTSWLPCALGDRRVIEEKGFVELVGSWHRTCWLSLTVLLYLLVPSCLTCLLAFTALDLLAVWLASLTALASFTARNTYSPPPPRYQSISGYRSCLLFGAINHLSPCPHSWLVPNLSNRKPPLSMDERSLFP